MLSEHERRTLREVERLLLTEDPDFARSFDARSRSLQHAPDAVGLKILVVAGLLLSALMLVTGSLSGAAAFAVATGIIWSVWRFSGAAPRTGVDPDRR